MTVKNDRSSKNKLSLKHLREANKSYRAVLKMFDKYRENYKLEIERSLKQMLDDNLQSSMVEQHQLRNDLDEALDALRGMKNAGWPLTVRARAILNKHDR